MLNKYTNGIYRDADTAKALWSPLEFLTTALLIYCNITQYSIYNLETFIKLEIYLIFL